MSSRLSPARLIGNLAALIALGLGLALLFDYAAVWLGHQSWLFCYVLQPIGKVAQVFGVIVCTVGLIMWGISFFRNDKAAALALGGSLLGAVPMLLPHYFGASCILP